MAETTTPPERLLSVSEVRERLGGIGKTWFYAQVKQERIRVVRLGRRTFVRASEVQRLIDEGSQA